MKGSTKYTIAECKLYAEARTVTRVYAAQIPGAKPTTTKYLDCVSVTGLITGGQKAKLKEYPHMV